MHIISSRCGGRRNGEYPKHSKYPKKEQDSSDSLIRQKSEELAQLKQLPVDEQNPKIDSQERYIDSLKKKIAELEEEKRQLKEQLKIDHQAGDIDSLQKTASGGNDPRKEDSSFPIKKERDPDSLIHQRDEEIEKLQRKINSQADEIDSLKKRIAELEEEVGQLKEKLTSLQGDRNILLIGEVCRNFQANLHQYVFPSEYISPYYSYKMADLGRKINNIQSAQEKAKARKLWEQLKQKEHPEKFQNLVEELQKLRNTTAHPEMTDLDIKEVLKAAEEVNEQRGFEFLRHTDFNFEDVKELMKMWARIDGYIKDSKK